MREAVVWVNHARTVLPAVGGYRFRGGDPRPGQIGRRLDLQRLETVQRDAQGVSVVVRVAPDLDGLSIGQFAELQRDVGVVRLSHDQDKAGRDILALAVRGSEILGTQQWIRDQGVKVTMVTRSPQIDVNKDGWRGGDPDPVIREDVAQRLLNQQADVEGDRLAGWHRDLHVERTGRSG